MYKCMYMYFTSARSFPTPSEDFGGSRGERAVA